MASKVPNHGKFRQLDINILRSGKNRETFFGRSVGLGHKNIQCLPLGIAVAGFFKSPDKFAPATMPVTAGKKTPNTVKKLGVLSGFW